MNSISIDKCSENHKLDELYSKLDVPLEYFNTNKSAYLSKKSTNLL
ncbi:hypothetical protein P5E54_09820 [Clostridium perfringens]|nr:hypothetical protein [Clostridium perfringens]ELC8370839.1 hypothetical protein [Clostridium perfringens]MDH2462659.1 hypothetical protein [Clostridium perfringens]MDK0811047.1 hypothetical protein [Clostridium perfringens]MDK0882192.1 hypothetical protein [Clostridium perfringens]MDU7237450.1 hypothetical protein [Clostridium perfringens]